MTKPATAVSHAPISDEQGKSILTRFISEGAADEFYKNANDLLDFSNLINAMGFSFEDLSAIADLYAFLTGIQEIGEDVTAQKFFADFSAALGKAANAFSADKLYPQGMNVIEIHPLIFSTPKILRSYGFGSMEALDKAIETASSSRKAGLEALRTYVSNLIRETTISIKGQDLVALGRFLEGYIKAGIQTNPEYMYYILMGMSGQLYRFDGHDAEGTARKAIYNLSRKYQNAASNVSTNANLLRALNLTGASYEKLLDLFKLYYDEGMNVEFGVLEDSPFDLTIYKAVEAIYDDLRDLVDGNDLKVLFEFAFRCLAEYTPEFEEQCREAEDPYALIVDKFDSLYGRLSASQKAALSRLAAVAGLDLDTMIEGLRGLADLPEGKTPMDVIQTVFKPVIDRYEPQFAGTPYYLESSQPSSAYSMPYAIAYLESESPTADEIKARLNFYDRQVGRYVQADKVELVGSPKGTLLKRQEAKVTINGVDKNYTYRVSFGYYSLPASLTSFQAVSATFSNLGAFPLLSSDIAQRVQDTKFANPGYVSKYDAKTHSIQHESVSFIYGYSDLVQEKGEHTLPLTAAGLDDAVDFSYQMYDSSDVKYQIESVYSGDNDKGGEISTNFGALLLTRAPKQNEQVLITLRGYIENNNQKNYRISLPMMRRALVTLPQINAGEEKTINVDGIVIPVYRFAESDCYDRDVSLYLSATSCRDESKQIYLLSEETPVESLLAYGTVYEYYQTDKYYRSVSRELKSADIRILGVDLSGDKGVIRTASLEYNGAAQEIRYAILGEDTLSLRNSGKPYAASVASLQQRSMTFPYYATLTSNGQTKDYSMGMAAYVSVADVFTFASEDATIGDHTVEATYQGLKIRFSYHIIDFSEVTIVNDEKRHAYVLDNYNSIVVTSTYFRAVYQGETIDSWDYRPESLDTTEPGKHSVNVTRNIYGSDVTYAFEYEVGSNVHYVFEQTQKDVYVRQNSTNNSIYVAMSLACTVEEGDFSINIGTMPYTLTAAQTATRGLHENEVIALSETVSMTLTYYVYADTDVQTTITDIAQSGEADLTSTSVVFSYLENNSIILEDGKAITSISSKSYVYEIPASDKTLGTHTATLTINGQPYEASYVISPKTTKRATLSQVNFTNRYQNVVAVGETLVASSAYIYVDSGDGPAPSQYVYGDSFTIVADVSAATSGYTTGYLIYDGQALTFEYLVYGADAQFGFLPTETDSPRTYVYGELRSGNRYSWYDYGYDTLTTSGATYAIGYNKSQSHEVSLTDNDVTIGEHQAVDGAHVSDYEIIGFKDSRIDLKSAVLNGQKGAYRVDEGVNFNLTIRYSMGNDDDYVRERYVNQSELKIEGFDTKTSTGENKRTATITYGDLVFSFDYLVYEESDIDPSTLTYEFESRNPYFLEGGSGGLYVEGYVQIYASLYGEKVLVGSEWRSEYVENPNWEIGIYNFSFNYADATIATSYEIVSQTDERLNWENAYVYGLSGNVLLIEEGATYLPNAYVDNLIIETTAGTYQLSGSLRVDAPIIQGLDASASTHGEIKQATIRSKYDTATFRYMVYAASEIQPEEIKQKDAAYFLSGDAYVSREFYFSYRLYLRDKDGNEYTLASSSQYLYVERTAEDETVGFVTDVTGRQELTFYINGQSVTKEVEYVFTCLTPDQCEVETSLNWDNGTFYQGITYESRQVFEGYVYYYYTPKTESNPKGDAPTPEQKRYQVGYRYFNFYDKGYTIAIDSDVVGEHVETITLDGQVFTYSYTVKAVPPIEYLRVIVLDPTTGEWAEVENGGRFEGNTDTFAFRIESNWAGDKLYLDTLDSEDDLSLEGYYGQWQGWGLDPAANHEATIKFTNALYSGWEFTFTYHSNNQAGENYDLYFQAVNWGVDGPKTGWSKIGDGVYESNNKGMDSTNANLFVDFVSGGVFTFTYDVDAENGCDYLILLVNGSYEAGLSGQGTYTVTVGVGSYITFRFQKDGSVSDGRDSAIVSNFVFEAFATPYGEWVCDSESVPLIRFDEDGRIYVEGQGFVSYGRDESENTYHYWFTIILDEQEIYADLIYNYADDTLTLTLTNGEELVFTRKA